MVVKITKDGASQMIEEMSMLTMLQNLIILSTVRQIIMVMPQKTVAIARMENILAQR
jgi:hypothetical protein